MERKKLISLDINVIGYQEALRQIINSAKMRTPSYACFANVHMTIEAHKDNVFRDCVNLSSYSFADGMPLVFAMKGLHKISQDRIAGIDFMMDAVKVCEKEKIGIFLFGSTTNVLEVLRNKLLMKFPDLIIAGSISPPFRELSSTENEAYIDQINNSGAGLVLVSLGCPKQEMWMSKHSERICAVMLGVGAAFEIHAGIRKRAPGWMQKSGLEWLFRLSQEPSRLLKRYTKTNSLFILLFLKTWLNKKTMRQRRLEEN